MCIIACIANLSVGAQTLNDLVSGESRIDQYIQNYIAIARKATDYKNNHRSFAETFSIMVFVWYTIVDKDLSKMYLQYLDEIYNTIMNTAQASNIIQEESSMVGKLLGTSHTYYIIDASLQKQQFSEQINVMCDKIIESCDQQIQKLRSSQYMNEQDQSISRELYMDAQYAVRAITQLKTKCTYLIDNANTLCGQQYKLYFPAIEVHKPSTVIQGHPATSISQIKLDAVRAELLGAYRPYFES